VNATARRAAADPPKLDPVIARAANGITGANAMAHVEFLASDPIAGRDAWSLQGRIAARYVASEFQRAGLEPGFDTKPERTWLDEFPQNADKPTGNTGLNVAGFWRGSDATLAGEWVLVCGHYDHLGRREDGAVFAGANDNASGTAVVIEVAHAFARERIRTARSILFVCFGGEERGLVGSKHMAANLPVPVDKIAAMINLDMVGTKLVNMIDKMVAVVGTEASPGIREILDGSAALVGQNLIYVTAEYVGPRSDHWHFQELGIPVAYFSTGPTPDYHTPSDTPDKLVPGQLERIGRTVFHVTREIANRADRIKVEKVTKGE
jgi:Zn-dependent M28 family amino/carboxypeptidase